MNNVISYSVEVRNCLESKQEALVLFIVKKLDVGIGTQVILLFSIKGHCIFLGLQLDYFILVMAET